MTQFFDKDIMLNKSPSVSIAIATYNRRHLLEKALTSILLQDYEGSIQIVVHDDGSTDDTEKYIKSLNLKNIFYSKSENQGRVIARNNALNRCDAPIVMILDSDDEWLPSKVREQMVFFLDPEVDYVYSLIKDTNCNGENSIRGGKIKDDLSKLHSISMPISTIAVRKSFLKEHNIFDMFYAKYRKIGFEHAEHTDLVYKLQVAGAGVFIDKPLALYRHHDNKVSQARPLFVSFTDLAAMIRLTQTGYMRFSILDFSWVIYRTIKRLTLGLIRIIINKKNV